MKIVKVVSLVAIMAFTQASFAECSVNLQAQKLIDCIVVEGAGDEYKEEKKTKAKNLQAKNSQKVVKAD